MCGRRVLIALAIFLGCLSPTLADTLNSFRKAHGLPALNRSSNLQAMAQRHANSMAARRSMDHEGFYSEAALVARAQKMSPMDARPKAAQCTCGKILADTAPTCRSLTSRVTALHRRVAAAIATGV